MESWQMTFARWREDGFDADFVAFELAKGIKAVSSGRGLVYSGTAFFGDPLTLLEAGVDFKVPIADRDRSQIITSELEAELRSTDYGERALIREINKATRDFSRLPEKKYIVATRLSFAHFEDISRREYSGSQLYVRRRLPRHLAEAHEEAKRQIMSNTGHDYSKDVHSEEYAAVWIHVSGRSPAEAVQRAGEALDLLRSIWNFALNRGSGRPFPPPNRGPLNEVLAGPTFSLHHPDGSLAGEPAWFDPQYAGPQHSYKLQEKWDEVRRDEDGIRDVLKRSPYRTTLEDSLRRYSRALDMVDLSTSFLNLWSLLETLTGITPRDAHEKVVKRAAFVYSSRERKTEEQVLQHLRRYCNSYVHSGEDSDQTGAYLHQLRGQAEQLLKFHLNHSRHFSSLEEAAQFLDLPHTTQDIQQLIDIKVREAEETQKIVRLAKEGLRFSQG